MNIRERVRGVMRRVGEVSWRELLSANLFAGREGRRTAGAGSNLAPFSSPGFSRAGIPGGGPRAGASAPHNLATKPTPANLRRFAETPVARRAINVIKDRIVGMRWRIQPRRGRVLEQIPDGAQRIQVLTENFEAPNPDDSFRSLIEQVLEDVIVGGFGAIELDLVDGWTGRTAGGTRALQISCAQSLMKLQFTPGRFRSNLLFDSNNVANCI